jgi:hypothetical protein
MKKTLMTCLAIATLFAIAGSASAITCTIDQHPAATLLVPYFEATIAPDGTPIGTGPDARDTLVTICNASSAPMIAHVSVFSELTALVLDFNIALTGFDCQSMSMARVLTGFLPATPITTAHATSANDACQRNPNAGVYSPPVVTGEYLRIRPVDTATDNDNTLATTLYPQPAWAPGSSFAIDVLDSLDATPDELSPSCTDGVDGVITNPIHGYLTIDHANYCNLSNPSDPNYYTADAIGNENNLFGEVIFTSGSGIPTMGGSTVNIEADPSLAGDSNDLVRKRTFYARYVGSDNTGVVPGFPTSIGCSANNCSLFTTNPWNVGVGDQREPLGLKYAARWFNTTGVTSNFNVWRASSGSLSDLTDGGDCDGVEPTVTLNFYDEDENTTLTGTCPSPCRAPTFNFPLETQRRNIASFSGSIPAFAAGWVSMSFFNSGGPNGGRLDQAWVEYDFQGPGAFLSASTPATQLDPSSCNPLGVTGVQTVAPAIPTVVGTGP